MSTTPASARAATASVTWAGWRPLDYGTLLYAALFLGWLAFGWGGPTLASAIDFGFFLPIGLSLGLLQLRVASALDDKRDRLAWRLLAVASFARFVSGNLWNVWILWIKTDIPWWTVAVASLFLVFGNAALLTFPSAPLRRVDRTRFGFDALIVLAGSLLILWFFVIVPVVRSGEAMALRDYVYTIGDTLAVVLSAMLYLRSSKPLTRLTALLLLAAYALQVVPDVLVRAARLPQYRAGDPIDIVWFAVWALKWIAARRALTLLATRREDVTQSSPEYRSGVLPVVFVAAATLVLLVQLASNAHADTRLFLFASGSLAALLVVRQLVELRERDRLQREMLAEASWFSIVLQHAYDFLALIDAKGRLAYLSPGTQRLLGSDAEGAPSDALLASLHPDDAGRLRELLAQGRFAPTVVSVRLRAQNGVWHDLSLRLQDLRDEQLVGGVVLNGHDVTREGELVRQLRDAKEVEALGMFASGLAHDLNNFLAVVGSHVELLRDEVPASHPQAVEDLLAIQSATKRATALTRGLMALSRRKTESRIVVDFGGLVATRLAKADADMRFVLPDQKFTVRADPVSMGHSIDSLVNERLAAGRAHGQPTVTLSSELLDAAEARRLELMPGRYVVLRIGADDVEQAGAASTSGTASFPLLELPRANEIWENAPDDLGTILVHASVREAGGALAVDSSPTSSRVALYLPSASE